MSSTDNSPIPVWLDMDPGHDNAFALILAGHCEGKLNILGVSSTHGNQTVEKTTHNVIRMATISGLEQLGEKSVFKGAEKPMVRESWICPEIHGESGLDGASWPKDISYPHHQKEHGVIALAKSVMSQPKGTVRLIATGCLTNIGLAIRLYPELIQHVHSLYWLGGSINFGNISPAAEFNVLIDPEAASLCFDAFTVYMVPLDVSHTFLVTESVISNLSKSLSSSPFSQILIQLLRFFEKTYKEEFGFHDGPPLHDPLAVGFLLYPELFQAEHHRVDIETRSQHCDGRTLVDLFHRSTKPKNCFVAKSVDVKGMWSKLIAACSSANNTSIANKKVDNKRKRDEKPINTAENKKIKLN